MTVRALNRHPLNLAARRRLLQDRLPQSGPNRELYLLQLAQAGLESEGEPASDQDPRRRVLADYLRSPRLQQSALLLLQDLLDPEDLQRRPLPYLADHISLSLKAETLGSP